MEMFGDQRKENTQKICEKKEEDDCHYTCELGTLFWVKIGSHPFWPCMVSYDPKDGTFFKKVKRGKGVKEIYHVQYFGKNATHGWTTGAMFNFDGKDKFFAQKNEAINNAARASKKKKLKMKFHVPSSVMKEWLYAVNDAEKALRYRIEDRYELYVFKYDINLKKNDKGKDKKRRKRKRRKLLDSKKPVKPLLTQATNIDEPLCTFCEKGSVDLFCSGICKRSFHRSCVGILDALDNFQCANCSSNNMKQPCVICKSVGTGTLKCIKCNFFYHNYCLELFKSADLKKNICSAHVCWSCFARNNRSAASKGSLVTCFRCPIAFHDTLNCMPVGGVRLSPTQMICPEHFLGRNRVSPQIVNNVSFCSSCFEGGELICCESCSNAFHRTCINGEVPRGDYYCDDCTAKKYLYTEMIVWSKSGGFRWWPAQIMNPDELPENIKQLPRYDGEFPIQFFGTDEYYWTHRAKLFPYNEINRNLRVSCFGGNKELRKKFIISLEEAAVAYEEYRQKFLNTDSKPNAFRHIRVNRAIPPAVIVNVPQSSCACSPSDENPCGPDSMCLNRSMLYECHADMCRAKDKCQNQRFQKREYASVKIIRTSDRGFGLQAQQFISEGSFVIEYVGEVITSKEYNKRVQQMRLTNYQNYYFLYLDKGRLIDAGPSGNLSRFINHSCNPNCVMEKWSVNNDLRIGIFALNDIQHGEELTFNYQSEVEFGQECYCGSDNCFGIIGKNGKKKKKNQ